MKPSDPLFEIHVCVGIDKIWRSPGDLWQEADRHIFQTHLQNEWTLLQYPSGHLVMEWVDHLDPYFQKSVSSLEHYRNHQNLEPYWFDYLVHRSGSCIEYAQISSLYEKMSSQYVFSDEDLLLRTRTDILLRYPIHLDLSITHTMPTREVFQTIFPKCRHFDQWEEQTGREVSILPLQFLKDRWIITMRKNLVYIMPMKAGKYLLEIAKHYGDWDSLNMNRYWFNAESQFRGCFRLHQFSVWEYSQQKDECYGEFEDQPLDFPLYAIYR